MKGPPWHINCHHVIIATLVVSQLGVCSEQTHSLPASSMPSTDSDYYFLEDGIEGEGPPTIMYNMSSTNVSVSRGGRAHLHCTIHNALRKTISWVRLKNMSNPGLLTVGQFVFSQDRRIVVNTTPATQQWSLTIMTAALEDSGWYECQVNTVPHISHQVYLSVIEPSCSISGEKSVYLNLGSSHSINCTVVSPEPPHHIFWYFNHQPLPHNVDWVVSSSLSSNSSWSVVRVSKVRLKHSGTYECRPSNSVPDAVNLIVLDGELHAAMQSNSADKKHFRKSELLMVNLVVIYFLLKRAE